MIIDANGRPAAASSICSHALSRVETLTAPDLKMLASQCLDAVWLQDARIDEIRSWRDNP
jgi:hypothetical protein